MKLGSAEPTVIFDEEPSTSLDTPCGIKIDSRVGIGSKILAGAGCVLAFGIPEPWDASGESQESKWHVEEPTSSGIRVAAVQLGLGATVSELLAERGSLAVQHDQEAVANLVDAKLRKQAPFLRSPLLARVDETVGLSWRSPDVWVSGEVLPDGTVELFVRNDRLRRVESGEWRRGEAIPPGILWGLGLSEG